MLKSLSCRNYRSLESVDIPLTPVTAIVGPNGSGKTSLLRAIDLVAGEFWPSMRSLRVPQDFTRFDATRELSITLEFDPTLTHEDVLKKTHDICFLRIVCKPYKRKTKRAEVGDLHLEFEPLGKDGEPPSVAIAKGPPKPAFRPLTVGTDLRDQAKVLMIDHRRSLLQHLPTLRGSALGRLFEPARKELDRAPSGGTSPRQTFQQQYEAAMQAIRTPRVQEVEARIKDTAKRMLGFLGTAAVEEIDVAFGFADPANPLNSLHIVYREGGLVIPGEELGLGIQSAIVVGIFEALRQLGGSIGTVVIEEPEMYLHPQAQRYFYHLLTDMADRGEAQVIYSTHSPIFADATRFEAIRLVRKEPKAMSTVSFVALDADAAFLAEQREAHRLALRFDPAKGELLFARRALLVEGSGDRLAVLLTAERLGIDLDAENLAVVACGAKSAIPFFVRVCATLGIPFYVLHDEDILPEEGDADNLKRIRENNEQAHKENNDIAASARDMSRVFILRPNLEALLGIGRGASEKPRRVLDGLEGTRTEDFPEPLHDAMRTFATQN